jgi:hypothetical protein
MAARFKPGPDIRLVTVLSTSDPGLVAIVKSLLDDAGLDYFVRGDALHNVIGWGGFNPALSDAEFQVREEDAEAATTLLARLAQPIAPVQPDDEGDT